MKKVAFYTLGCKVNQYETEAMTELFEDSGYEAVGFDERADVYVINTCTVTGLSARKSRQAARRARAANSDAVVAVVGCYPQASPDEVEKMEGVDIIIGTRDRLKILEYIAAYEARGTRVKAVGDIMRDHGFEALKIDRYKDRTRAFLKIQDGCSQFCAYCIIPYARGPVRSRLPEDVLSEVVKLAAGGFREVVLTGIHIASYGRDLPDMSLLKLVKRIHAVEGIDRLRLGSIEPRTVTPEFAEAAGGLKKLCPHYHISLQSGCDATLKRMNRKYTTGDYRRVIALLRENVPDVAVSTDVMVGFPGETEAEFEATVSFLEEMRFSKMHIFKYSPRKGTPAASFEDQIEGGIKEERSRRLIALSDLQALEFNTRFCGRTLPVLFERQARGRTGFFEGLTPNYIRVVCPGNTGLEGNIADVLLRSAENDCVIGELA
jgi:threonylcarbamoyladenosine tRNA methylthiotransferase MtaB